MPYLNLFSDIVSDKLKFNKTIYGRVFNLHNQTIWLMVIFVLTTGAAKLDTNESISCDTFNEDAKVLTGFCLVNSTFTPKTTDFENGPRRIHSYYVQASYNLLFQLFAFLLPGYFWRCFESRRIDKCNQQSV